MSVPSLAHSLRGLGFCFLSLCFVLLLQRATGAKRELKYVAVVYRHGDRNPLATFPTNPIPETIWPGGFGQLTKKGMKQQYQLGQFLRARYNKFLSPEYKEKEIHVLSTNKDRTIMSAKANLAGLFSAPSEKFSMERIALQPVPVNILPKNDKLLSFPNLSCPRFLMLLKETMGSPAFMAKLKDYMPLIGQIAAKLQYDVKKLLDINNRILWNLYDTLLVQKIHKHPNVAWADEATMKKLKSLLEVVITAVFGDPKRQEKGRLQGGLLVKDILGQMTKAVNKEDSRKMMMYSAHDITIIALQSALDVYNKKLPPYAATHLFELYQEADGKFTVEMYYMTKIKKGPAPLTLPGCSKACPFDKFKQLVAPVIVNDWDSECSKV